MANIFDQSEFEMLKRSAEEQALRQARKEAEGLLNPVDLSTRGKIWRDLEDIAGDGETHRLIQQLPFVSDRGYAIFSLEPDHKVERGPGTAPANEHYLLFVPTRKIRVSVPLNTKGSYGRWTHASGCCSNEQPRGFANVERACYISQGGIDIDLLSVNLRTIMQACDHFADREWAAIPYEGDTLRSRYVSRVKALIERQVEDRTFKERTGVIFTDASEKPFVAINSSGEKHYDDD